MEYSQYQKDIFNWIENGEGHLLVKARAGSGKSFTIEHCLKYIDPFDKVLMVAFNRHNVKTLQNRVRHMSTEIKTLNSFGWSICTSQAGKVKLDEWKVRKALRKEASNKVQKGMISAGIKLISLRKATGLQNWITISEKFDVDLPEDIDLGFLDTVYQQVISDTKTMDYDDQLFMPIHNRWTVPKYDWVFVDEAQDLSRTQMELVRQAGNRVIAVGDPEQSIYTWRGADPEAMRIFGEILGNPTEKTLPVCYRCPTAVLDIARKIVPDIMNAPNAIRGEVINGELDPVDGDYVLCRVTAPLVQYCLKMISRGQKAMVRGREVGSKLVEIIKKVGVDLSIEVFTPMLTSYVKGEVDRLNQLERPNAAQRVEDHYECILALMDGAQCVDDILERIDTIFQNEDEGVIFSTVHRAKGLEADNIYVLAPNLMPFPKAKLAWQRKQEQNIIYVAVTRAMKKLVFVGKLQPRYEIIA